MYGEPCFDPELDPNEMLPCGLTRAELREDLERHETLFQIHEAVRMGEIRSRLQALAEAFGKIFEDAIEATMRLSRSRTHQ